MLAIKAHAGLPRGLCDKMRDRLALPGGVTPRYVLPSFRRTGLLDSEYGTGRPRRLSRRVPASCELCPLKLQAEYFPRSGEACLRYRWLRHRLKNYNEQNFIIIAILIMIAAHLSFLLLLSFLFLFLL